MTSIIQIKNYVKKYKNVIIKVKDISIHNRLTIIKGNNGSGKSTLIRSIMGLNHYEGEIVVNGSLSYMEEHPVFPNDCTVGLFLDSLNILDKTTFDDLVSMFNLSHKKNAKIKTLSKGMRMKLNIVQCLMKNADMYILDEPFNGLDNISVSKLIDFIKHSSKCFLITSHINELIEVIECERIVI